MPTVTVQVLNGGSNIDLEGLEVESGETINIYIACNNGYYFDYAIDDWGNIIKSNPIKLKVNDNISFRAICTRPYNSLNLIIQDTNKGTVLVQYQYREEEFVEEITDTKRFNVDSFSTVRLTAYANEGFVFDGWLANGKMLSKEESFSFEMPLNEVDLIAMFKEQEFEIKVAYDKALGIVTGDGLYPRNATVKLEANELPGARFVGWKKADEFISTEPTLEFQAISNELLHAVFEPKLSTIILRGNWQNYTDVNFTPFVEYNKSLTISIPKIEYYKPIWKINGEDYAENVHQITVFGTGEPIIIDLDYIPQEVPVKVHIYPYDCAKIFIDGDKIYNNIVVINGFASNVNKIKQMVFSTPQHFETYEVNDFEFTIPIMLKEDNTINILCETQSETEKKVEIQYLIKQYERRSRTVPVVRSFIPEKISLSQYYDYLSLSDIFNLPTGEKSSFSDYLSYDKIGWPEMFENCSFAILEPYEPVLDILQVKTNRTLRYGLDFVVYTFEPSTSFSRYNKPVIIIRPEIDVEELTVEYLTIKDGQQISEYIESLKPLMGNVIFKFEDIVWIHNHKKTSQEEINVINELLSQRKMQFLSIQVLKEINAYDPDEFLVEVSNVYGHRITPIFDGFPLKNRLLQLSPFKSDILFA